LAQELEGNDKPSNIRPGDTLLMSDGYEGGDGSKENPYQIADKEQLIYFAQNINSGVGVDLHYKLLNDIDLNSDTWTPVGFFSNDTLYSCAFKGSFDGNGHTISNFAINQAETRYVGFFGLVYNASVKNLSLDNITIDISRTGSNVPDTYVGTLAGRVVSDAIGGKTSISNCHVTNCSISAYSDKNLFAGGIIGYAVSGSNTELAIYHVSADCDVDVAVNASNYYNQSTYEPYTAAGSGLFGCIGSLTDAVFSLRKSYSTGDVIVDTSLSEYVHGFSGGIVAQAATRMSNQKGGTAYFSSCYSTGDMTVNSKRIAFAGGFAGSVGATDTMYIFDCYSTGNVCGSTLALTSDTGYVAAGGFIGQAEFDESKYSESMEKPIYNCYASGDAIDTLYESGKSIDSYVGGLVGYSFAPLFKNCYELESQTVTGKNVFSISGIYTISAEDAVSCDSYSGFDFDNVWEIDSNALYQYPTLIKNYGLALFFSDDEYFSESYFGEDGKVSAPKAIPQKASTPEFTYTFSHWSLEPDGEEYDFDNDSVNAQTSFYAVFNSQKQVYNVTFISEGMAFGNALQVEYGGLITPISTIPTKSETSRYRYEFDHWSLTSDGDEVDFSSYIVTNNTELYAVFNEIDKTSWNGEVADSFSEGYGTSSLPYIISSAEEFALFAKVVNEANTDYSTAYYVLGNDINLGNNLWTPIGTEENPFSAKLDGCGYSIRCFQLQEGKYVGLFGYVKNASIKNLYLSDFEIDIQNYDLDSEIYVGGLAGYITCKGQNTIIDSIYVDATGFDVSVSAKKLYAGNIAGYVNSESGKSLITNCYATSDIFASNDGETSSTYAGGLAGYMYTYASTLAKASECYYVGSVTAYGTLKCSAGGLAGSVYSYGSAYSPSVPIGSLSNESLDIDIMLANSFANANVSASSSLTTKTSAYAGAVSGEVSQYAGVSNIFYRRGSSITSTGSVSIYGTSASANNLLSESFICDTIGFDFVNTWTYVGTGEYPVLKCMYSDKPILRLNNVEFTDGTLSASVTAYAKSSYYTVIIGVYNERNQLIASQRKRFTSSELANEFDINIDNLSSPVRIKVSAFDSVTFTPLFSAVEWYL
ncbi:MAG: InlB B-repeat-containing protein, partial [Clostridia bacterium]|nr:InlB B-repeat-containing protein [Clostridia bacterium]